MKEDKEWPSDTIALLAKKVIGWVRNQDYVNWAVQALTEGFDSQNLSILAGLDLDKEFSQGEAEQFFAKVVHEFGWIIPDDEIILRRHLDILAEKIQKGKVDPEIAVDQIHREVVSPLGHPGDLLPWCSLWDGSYALGYGTNPIEEYSSQIIHFAGEWLNEHGKDE